MPSFTLLGPTVLRLPFILESSYPHEVLHNWWGNGVYPAPTGGNWTEGLTAYLADHLMEDRRGRGGEYRHAALMKYADYVSDHEDFPLSAFTTRHGEVTQAIGYSKGLMLFHMLRLKLGNSVFLAGLRRFYAEHRFRHAVFTDLKVAFDSAGNQDLGPFFAQWLERTGAPQLALGRTGVTQTGKTWQIQCILKQT